MITGAFMNSFRAKGRYAQLMAEIPVYIILNPNTSQLGAAQAACELLD
jgi:glucokinase